MPFAPFRGAPTGFDIPEWGAHDMPTGRTKVSPPALLDLATREGIVPPREYEETCRRLEGMLLDLATPDGRPLVRDVIRTAPRTEDALTLSIPDLVVHWHDAAFDSPVGVKGMTLESRPIGMKLTAQHALEGFLIARSRQAVAETVLDEDLHRLFEAALRRDS